MSRPIPAWAEAFYRRWGFLPVAGGSGEDEDRDETPPETTDDADADEDPPEDDDGPEGGSPPTGDDEDGETVPRAELDRVRTRMQAADKRASDLQKQRDELRDERDRLRVELAVVRAVHEGEHRYEDPELVLDLVRERVAVKNGEPVKVDEALSWLRDRHPYLLAEEDGERVEPDKLHPSGRPANRKRQGAPKVDAEKLRRKYSALSRGRR